MQYFAGIESLDDETNESIIEIAIKNFPICIILKILAWIWVFHVRISKWNFHDKILVQ